MNRSPETQTKKRIETLSQNPDLLNAPSITEVHKSTPSFEVQLKTGSAEQPFVGAIVLPSEALSSESSLPTSFAVTKEGTLSYTIDKSDSGVGIIRIDQYGVASALEGEDGSNIGVIDGLTVEDEIIVTEKSAVKDFVAEDKNPKESLKELLDDEEPAVDIVRVQFSEEAKSEKQKQDRQAAYARRAQKRNKKQQMNLEEVAVSVKSANQIAEEEAAQEELQGYRVIDKRGSESEKEQPAVMDAEGKLYPLDKELYGLTEEEQGKLISYVVDTSAVEVVANHESSEESTEDSEIIEAREKLDELRDAMAQLAAKRQGRLFGGNSTKYATLEAEYTEQLQHLGRLECADLLTDENKTVEEKNVGVIAYIFDEQQRLRNETASKLKATKTSRFLDKITTGTKKQQFIKGAALGLVAVGVGTGIGALVGVAAGAGLATAAAVTAKSTINFGRFYAKKDNEQGRGISALTNSEIVATKEDAKRTLELKSDQDSFVAASNYYNDKFNRDTQIEQEKRRKAAKSALGGVALGMVLGGTIAAAVGEFADGRVGQWSNRTIDTPTGALDVPDRQMLPPEPLDLSTPDEALPTPDLEDTPTDGMESPEAVPVAPDSESSYEYSDSALTVDAGEGWYQTFNEIGITSAAQQYELLHNEALMQELARQGLAYRDVSLGGWGMNMTTDGKLPVQALETIRQYTR